MAQTTPRIESITAALETAINEITEGNGFNQDLVAVRIKRYTFDAINPENGKVLIIEMDDEDLLDQNAQTDKWLQRYSLQAYVIEAKGIDTAIGIKLNKVKSDIRKKLSIEPRTFGGLALDTTMKEASPFVDTEGNTGIIVDIEVKYETKAGDPFTAR